MTDVIDLPHATRNRPAAGRTTPVGESLADWIEGFDVLSRHVSAAEAILGSTVGCEALHAPALSATRRGLWLAIRDRLEAAQDDADLLGVRAEWDALWALAHHACEHFEHHDGLRFDLSDCYAWGAQCMAGNLIDLARENLHRRQAAEAG